VCGRSSGKSEHRHLLLLHTLDRTSTTLTPP
jgi:hypothetical protein